MESYVSSPDKSADINEDGSLDAVSMECNFGEPPRFERFGENSRYSSLAEDVIGPVDHDENDSLDAVSMDCNDGEESFGRTEFERFGENSGYSDGSFDGDNGKSSGNCSGENSGCFSVEESSIGSSDLACGEF